MNKLLSIIIPCYNVESFIHSCLEHLSKIPLSVTDYEIICYNDCSTDNTLSILENETKCYSNLKVLQGSVNIGPGGGRNKALKTACGEYVWFVDADDIILPDVIVRFSALCHDKIDVIPFNYKDVDADGNIIAEPIVFKDSAVMNGLDFVESVFQTGIIYHMGYPVRFFVRREFLLQNNILFPEGIRYGEDTVWMPQILLLAQKVASVSSFGYMYRHHSQRTCGMFGDSYPGRIIYERCINAGSLLLTFANEITTLVNDDRITKYAQAFRKAVKRYYIGQLPIYLGRASKKERKIFFAYLKNNGYNKEVAQYAPLLSRVLLYPIIGRIIAEIVAIGYKLKH